MEIGGQFLCFVPSRCAHITRLTPASKKTPASERVAINWSSDYAKRFKTAMDDDFNTPDAVAVLFEMASEISRTSSNELAGQFKALANILGLLQRDPSDYLQGRTVAEGEITPEQIEAQVTACLDACKGPPGAASKLAANKEAALGRLFCWHGLNTEKRQRRALFPTAFRTKRLLAGVHELTLIVELSLDY